MPDDTVETVETVLLSEIRVTYYQPNDCCESKDKGQYITFVGQNNGVDWYYYIKTNRWAIDDKTEIEKLFQDFERRLFAAKDNDDILEDKNNGGKS